MILVDTSVRIDHFRKSGPELIAALDSGQVLIQPFVVGELACGNLNNRVELLSLLRALPPAPVATDSEALGFIDRHELMGRGIGYLDVHLLASVALAGPAWLWTRDKRLAIVADSLRLAIQPEAR
jgi:predicted nucleic acid-binding protein